MLISVHFCTLVFIIYRRTTTGCRRPCTCPSRCWSSAESSSSYPPSGSSRRRRQSTGREHKRLLLINTPPPTFFFKLTEFAMPQSKKRQFITFRAILTFWHISIQISYFWRIQFCSPRSYFLCESPQKTINFELEFTKVRTLSKPSIA